MSSEDPLSIAVQVHAGAALQGLTTLGASSAGGGEDLDKTLTVELVHDLRTSLRRLRAMLRALPASFTVPEGTDGDLRSVARALGAVRDGDVLLERLVTQREEFAGGSSAPSDAGHAELIEALRIRRRAGVEQVARARGGQEWSNTLAQLDRWRRDPPGLTAEPTPELLEGLRERARSRLRAAADDTTALHTARRAAKRWRYVAEMLLPVMPVASAHHEAASRIHTRLGQLQDAVVAAELLRELGDDRRRRGLEDGLAADLLERELRRIQEIVAEAPHLL